MSEVEIRFTGPERQHLLNLLRQEKESGDYYGRREQYYARTDRLIAILEMDNEQKRGKR